MIVSKTWIYINHNGFLLDKDGTKYQVLRYIQIFKLNYFPDETPQKYKARNYYDGDI